MTLEWFMAWKYMRGSKGFASVVAWFSFLGIALGVATLIIVMSVMNGFRHELWSSLVGVRGHVLIDKPGAFPLSEAADLVQKTRNDPRTESVLPILDRQAVIMTNAQARGVQLQGVRPEDLPLRPRMALQEGKVFENGVWIGNQLSYLLNVKVGDMINLMQPFGRATPFGRVPEQIRVMVQGIFSTGMYEFDKNIILMGLHQAQEFFHEGDNISHIEIHLHKNVDTALFMKDRPVASPYRMLDWKHSDAAIFHAVEVERHVMFVILTLIVLIASFNIISSLIMLVQQKTRDIAIMRTLGVQRAAIGRIFLITGSSIGIFGTAIGVAMGLGFATHIENIRRWLESLTGTNLFQAEIYFLSRLPCKVNPHEVIGIAALALAITILAALYPAWRASKMEPVDALRY